jgi:hypothetical protein
MYACMYYYLHTLGVGDEHGADGHDGGGEDHAECDVDVAVEGPEEVQPATLLM